MISKIYLKLVRYVTGLIVTTCIAALVLFFMVVALPMADDFHRLIRKQVGYISWLMQDLIESQASKDRLHEFLVTTGDSYEMELYLLDDHLTIIDGSLETDNERVHLPPETQRPVTKDGIFSRPGHFGKPTIYVMALSPARSGPAYLCIIKRSAMSKAYLLLAVGLGVICILMILAIYPLAKSFTGPIVQLTRAIDRISTGQFLPEIDIKKPDDELGELLHGFQHMSQSVDRMIKSKQQLLADISHELRSPLGRMRVATELLKGETSASEKNRHIRNMEDEIEFMDEMIRSLSAYSRINLPDFKLNAEQIIPTELIDELVHRFQPMMSKRGFSLKKKTEPAITPLMLDKHLFVLLLSNLLNNAMQYCRPGGEITIGVTEKQEITRFFVSDTGAGVDDSLCEKIFMPLFRADPSRSRHTGGVGLGLAIAKRIVALHGGEIGYHRENGVTVFRVDV